MNGTNEADDAPQPAEAKIFEGRALKNLKYATVGLAR